MSEERRLDCRGLDCPQPVVKTRAALEELSEESLKVIVDNEGSSTNVKRFAESQGYQVQVETREGEFYLRIRKGEGGPVSEYLPIECAVPRKRNIVIYISSEVMGRGDAELGRVLMAAYLNTLSQFAGEISHIIFVNSGVKLAVEGSPVLDELRQLEDMGVEVLACGTCLNHFGIKERLRVGSVSNMFSIVETLSGAGRCLSP